jgi:hypothetical protein
MPAIRLALLRQQAALLADYFFEPSAYVRSLHHLMEFYAEYARRQGYSGEPPPLIESYHVRPQVLRQVLIELDPYINESPIASLQLADSLWDEPYLEFRLLASGLIGRVRPLPSSEVVNRIQKWIETLPDRLIVEALLSDGCRRLRAEEPLAYLQMAEHWMNNGSLSIQQIGIQSLTAVVKDINFENLPTIFTLLDPLVQEVSPVLRPDVLDLLGQLAERSPHETAYFLRQNLNVQEHSDVPFLIRQSLEHFPEDIKENLLIEVRR